MGWLRRSERRQFANAFLTGSTTGVGWAGEDVGEGRALRLSSVWACVRLLTETLSTLPVDAYDSSTGLEVAKPSLLRAPAAGLSLHDWLSQVMVSLLLRGNAYGLVVARNAGSASQVELLNPDHMVVSVGIDGRIEYRYRGAVLSRSEVWHVRGLSLPGQVCGLSPVEYARQSIGLGLAAERYGAKWFDDYGQPSGVLTSAAHLNANQAELLQKHWQIARSSSKVAVVTGDITFTPISIAPDESQFIESRRLSVAEIARIYGIPPEMIGGEAGGSLTYANVEQRGLDFLTYSLGPWIARLEGAITLLLGDRYFCKLNTGALVRTDLKSRYDSYAVALSSGFLTVDEVRALEDRPPLPGGLA